MQEGHARRIFPGVITRIILSLQHLKFVTEKRGTKKNAGEKKNKNRANFGGSKIK